MFKVDCNGIITITRGDSFSCPIFINQGTATKPSRYDLREHTMDTVYVAVMEPNQPFENAILKKKYTYEDVNENGDAIMRFEPEDTACLIPGKYFYQIKLRAFKNNKYDVNTIISKTQFFVEE